MQPKISLSYSQEDPYFVTAMFHVEAHKDLYGWYMKAQGQNLSAAFFMLENFYVNRPPVLYRSIEDDVHAPWMIDYPQAKGEIRCPIPESISHELERIQSIFVQEWLFFPTDPDIATEIAAYRAHGLSVQIANIKFRKLCRFDKENEYWVHATPGIDSNITQFLEKYGHFGEKASL
ncbi:MAG TPA: hypothetical protein VJ577_21525 [Burkholderiaceae bacterium]|nr:hypothetical protein [Burkholderiaceae bacterium]